MGNNLEGKRFAADFVRIDRVKANDKILIYDSADGTVKYAQPSQINAVFEKFVTDSETATTAAASASSSASSAASSKDDAKVAEDAAEGWANDAKTAAGNAASDASKAEASAARSQQAADNAAAQVIGAYDGVTGVLAQSGSSLDERVSTLEKLLVGLLSGNIIAEKLVVRNLQVFGETSLIKWGEGAPVVAPDFVGQRYIDTTNKLVYTAVGNAAVADWTQQ